MGNFESLIYNAGAEIITQSAVPGFDITSIINEQYLKNSLGRRVRDRFGNEFMAVKCSPTAISGSPTYGKIVSYVAPIDVIVDQAECVSEAWSGTNYYHTVAVDDGAGAEVAAAAGDWTGGIFLWDFYSGTKDANYYGKYRFIYEHTQSGTADLLRIAERVNTPKGWSYDALANQPTDNATAKVILPHTIALADADLTDGGYQTGCLGVTVANVTANYYTLILTKGYYYVWVGDTDTNNITDGDEIQLSTTAGKGEIFNGGGTTYYPRIGFSVQSADHDDNTAANVCPAYICPEMYRTQQ